MHCDGKLKLRSCNTSYCLIEVVNKEGLIISVCIIKINFENTIIKYSLVENLISNKKNVF